MRPVLTFGFLVVAGLLIIARSWAGWPSHALDVLMPAGGGFCVGVGFTNLMSAWRARR